jgi:ubiquitin-like modifier-activating enzyme ATG7
VVRAYDRDGWAFVRRALAEKGFVEEVSGLAEVQRRAEELDAELDWEGEEDGDGELL